MSGEPDCTATSGGSGFILESPLNSIISSHRKSNNNTINSNKLNNNNNEDTDCDLEKAVCASSNNNNCIVNNNNLNNLTNNGLNSSSKIGNNNNNSSSSNSNHAAAIATTTAAAAAVAAAASNFLNDVQNLESKSVMKCERCDSFETISHALLLVHVAQCRGDGNNASSGSSRQYHDGSIDNYSGSVTMTQIPNVGDAANENDATQSTMDSTSAAASSSTINMNSDSSNSQSASLQLKQNADAKSAAAAGQQQHQRKLFECDVCNMKFSNGANMRRHKMRHTGVKPYECRVCQKRFFRKDHLAEHFTTHTKTLPYHCPICNRGFQRQIAMRAHFQNEHVGQNDLVKTCPLCNYRAGTMKSLRIHFFNRHGIDLDNPGPNAPSSLLLALDPTNASNYLPSIALAAAAAAAAANSANNSNMSIGNSIDQSHEQNDCEANDMRRVPSLSQYVPLNQVHEHHPNRRIDDDSGDSLQDSLRSNENGTPPMHFLTPHVEISMAENDTFKTEPMPASISSALLDIQQSSANSSNRPLNGGSPSPHSADSNSNAPSSSQSLISSALQNSRHLLHDGQITPSISLIPIKQEPSCDDYDSLAKSLRQQSMDQSASAQNSVTTNSVETSAASSSNLTSLIKVSPLKSLLREDLKRRISARATNRATRNSNNANNNGNVSNSITSNLNSNSNSGGSASTNTSNPTSITTSSALTSSSSSSSLPFNSKKSSSSSLASTINAINQHLLSNSSITVTTESTTPSSGTNTYNGATSRSPLAAVATTSNGAITSTGAESELLLAAATSGQRGKRMLQCLFCGIEFPDQTLYFLHKGCHSESNPWKCNICGEQCNNVYEFNSHLLSKSHQ